MKLRRAEKRQNSVSFEFVNCPFMPKDNFCHDTQVFVKEADYLLWTQLLGKGGESAYIGKEDCKVGTITA